jgi:tetratricopeptide (TPR) repeat protein
MTEPFLVRATSIPEAEPVLRMYVDDFAGDARPILALGHYYIVMGQLEKAQPLVEAQQRDYPKDPATHVLNGDYLAAAGDVEGAIREFEAVLANPRTPTDTRSLVQRRLNLLKGTPDP